MTQVVILGGGNLAQHLIKAFLVSSKVQLVQVYNRSLSKVQKFSKKTSITDNIQELKKADVYIICVSDNAVESVSNHLSIEDALVVHTSGMMSLDVLKKHKNRGVFYPLQTFSKDVQVDFQEVPILTESNTKKGAILLESLAHILSKNLYRINSEQRKHIHLVAVLVNNFVNHLYFLGYQHLEKNNIPAKLMLPLIKETLNKINRVHPLEAQTGPAKRADKSTIQAHKEMIENENFKQVYSSLTKSILETYGKKL